MPDLFGDRVIDAIASKQAPICVGIDPIYDQFPEEFTDDVDPGDTEAVIDSIFEFTLRVLETVAPLVPVVKFQSAYFEKYLWEGVEAYYSLIAEAKAMGLMVIGDVKRGDIGTTAAAYAEGHLDDLATDDIEDAATPDAVTVNPMLGADTIEPFIRVARATDKGLFVLVRTSNPGSAEFQDVLLADGRTWSEMLADRVNQIALSEGVGSSGYSSIGAVVGATQPQTMLSLRQRLPKSVFLLPGYGTQGATADMTRLAFQNRTGGDKTGAIVSASRSILYAHKDKKHAAAFGDDWEECVKQAVLDMKADLANVLS